MVYPDNTDTVLNARDFKMDTTNDTFSFVIDTSKSDCKMGCSVLISTYVLYDDD